MGDVRFEDEQDYARPRASKGPSFFSRFVIRTGLATDEKSAQQILLVALVVLVVIFIIINWPRGSSATPSLSAQSQANMPGFIPGAR